ncbi:ATP-binding protein [Clostridium vincentii]|uniref:histidine kinase n=1 Tax=Clostridium vincentii TaxID=52704 RepID=A0A2T0BD95_9CLOT|nr:ATP-binding protein [Clostridium vincentii]PRR81861.1 Sensor histidine kinase TmoS [Clostridium vincentii]
MSDFYNYTVLSVLYEEDNFKIVRVCQSNGGEKEILKIARKKGSSIKYLSTVKQEFELLEELNKHCCRHIVNAKKVLNFEKESCLVLEDVAGMPLIEVCHKIKETGDDYIEKLLDVAIDLVEAIEHVHWVGILHNELRSDRILLDAESLNVVIIDFYFALPIDNYGIEADEISKPEGLYPYISPERTGRTRYKIDQRSDLYSLGIILYEIFSGHQPFMTKDILDLVHCHIAVNPPRLVDLILDFPVMISSIIEKLMMKELTDRYQSANILKADLIYCRQMWHSNKDIPVFELGRNDYFGTIYFPKKLYGRDKELSYMKEWLGKCKHEKASMLLVSGYSGVGKTTLVEKSCKYYINEESFFVKGKFEESKKQIPYFALTQLAVALVNRIMKEEKTVCEEISKRCIEALGEQTGILLPLIPNLEKLLGKLKEVSKVDSKQTESRMYYALEKFLKTLTSPEKPIIFFVDDIQWADNSSMDMINNILDMGLINAFFICAYRENEIEHQFKFKKTIEGWEQRKNADVLYLKCLEKDYIEQFVSDSLHMNCSDVKELACVIHEKTRGNIFFARQFLMLLQNKGVLYLHSGKNESFGYNWKWNIENIRSQCVTENVIDIVLENLKLIPEEDMNIIKIAACIGNYFDMDILTSVCDVKDSRIKSILFNFWKAGMITYEKNVSFFSHDRIHQAIYSMVSDEKLPRIHLKIGKVMIKELSIDVQEEKIFDIVFQWNQGSSEIKNPEDIIMMAKLNLQATRKAKENSAYIEAKNYGEKAEFFVSGATVQQNYKLALEIYDEMSVVNFLLGEHAEAYTYTEKALLTTERVEEKFNAYQVRVKIEMARSHLREAIQIAFEYLELLGEKVEIITSQDEISFALSNIKNMLGINPAEKLAKLPQIVSYHHLIAIKMLSYIITSTYMTSKILHFQIIIKVIELSLKYGNATESIIAWVCYGRLYVSEYGEMEEGYKIGDTAINMRSKFKNQEIRSKFTFIVLLAHIKHPFKSILKSCLVLYEEGLKSGDLEDSCQGLLQYGNFSFHAGCELAQLEKELIEMIWIVEECKQKTVYNRLAITLQVIINLRQSSKPYILCGRIFDESKMIPIFQTLEDRAAIFIWASQKIMLCCLYGRYDEIDYAVKLVEQYKANTPGQVFEFNYHYYLALCKLRKIKIIDKMNEEDVLEIVKENMDKVEDWIQKSETNYIHKCLILRAEFNRAIGRKLEAIELYNNAIENASENDFIQDAAFALELLGLYHLELKNKVTAEMYLQKASEYYEKWGAFTKVEDIKSQYFSKKKDKLEFQAAIETNESDIDLHSILLAAQTLSEEIEINSLIKKMMHIIMVNSGATKALFLEYRKGVLVAGKGHFAEADSDWQGGDFIKFINCMDEKVLPWSIVNYTIKQEELMMSDNPMEDPDFNQDLYIQQENPKSVIYIPLHRKDNLIGVIYLENKIFSGAFTSKQIEVIKMISAQIAISLENARLYSNLEERVRERTVALKNTVIKLKSEINERKIAEKALYENEERLREVKAYDKLKTEFFANISHELKTPLNVIYSALQMCNILISDDSSYKDNDIHKYMQMIKQNCYRLIRLINNIIDITKIDSGYLSLYLKNEDIVSTVENMVMSVVNYAETKGINIIFDTDIEERIMACDIDKIERVVLNLLSNAIKFTERNGHIYVNIFNKEKSIIISIKDTGTGIPEEKLEMIFERFIQVDKSISRNQEGSGIGLSLVKELVIMHNGNISVKSIIGKGSEFIVEIPVYTTTDNESNMKKCEDKENSKIEKINIEFSDIYF